MRPSLPAVGLWVLAAALFGGRGTAQTLTTNDEGERIVVYPDGSWRYFSDPPPPVDEASAAELPLEEEEYREPGLSAEAEARARAIVRQRVEVQQKAASKLRRSLDRRVRDESKAYTRVEKLEAEGAERDEIQQARREREEATQRRIRISDELAILELETQHLERTVSMTRAQRTAYLVDVGLERVSSGVTTAMAAAAPASSPAERQAPSTEPDPTYRTYSRARDPRLNPPTPECVFAYEGVDEFTKKLRRDLAAETLFAYTPEGQRRVAGQDDFITATGRLIDVDGDITFAVTYTIRSVYAAREFGALPRGAALTLKLVGGGAVELRNAKLVQGEYDPVDKVTRYEARYPVDRTTVRTLSRRYLDEARVTWGTGFEDYPLYDIDYFRRLLACL